MHWSSDACVTHLCTLPLFTLIIFTLFDTLKTNFAVKVHAFSECVSRKKIKVNLPTLMFIRNYFVKAVILDPAHLLSLIQRQQSQAYPPATCWGGLFKRYHGYLEAVELRVTGFLPPLSPLNLFI